MTVEDTPASYDVKSSEVVYRSGRVIDLHRDLVVMPDGSEAQRDVVVHPGAVGVIPMRDDGRVLLLRQYRHPVRQLLWEPPAGLLDEPGEDPLVTAQRELYEEAHLQAGRWNVLVDGFTSPGMSGEAVRIYLARDVSAAQGPRHEAQHEERDMPTLWIPLDDAVTAALEGRLHNPLALMGLLALSVARTRGLETLRPGDAPWPQLGTFRGSAAS